MIRDIENLLFNHSPCIRTIYFWESVDRTLQEMYRALRPGGRFVLTYCDGKAGEEGEKLHERIEREFIPLANKGDSNQSF